MTLLIVRIFCRNRAQKRKRRPVVPWAFALDLPSRRLPARQRMPMSVRYGAIPMLLPSLAAW